MVSNTSKDVMMVILNPVMDAVPLVRKNPDGSALEDHPINHRFVGNSSPIEYN